MTSLTGWQWSPMCLGILAVSTISAAAPSGEHDASTPASPPNSTLDPLPPEWKADGGIPVDLGDGSTLFMFGDTVIPGEGMVHNSATIMRDGEIETVLSHPQGLLADGTDTWFWPSDAVVHPTGELLVVANEVERDVSNWFGFSTVDTDAFVVTDPSNVMSWRLAEHVDEGWWDGYNVAFSDWEHPQWAFLRPYGERSTYFLDTTMPTAAPEPFFDAGSDGVFQPVSWGRTFVGISWEMEGSWTLWRLDPLAVRWDEVSTTEFDGVQYGHALHIIDGRVWLKWSNGDGTQRVEYHDVTDMVTP